MSLPLVSRMVRFGHETSSSGSKPQSIFSAENANERTSRTAAIDRRKRLFMKRSLLSGNKYQFSLDFLLPVRQFNQIHSRTHFLRFPNHTVFAGRLFSMSQDFDETAVQGINP